MGRLGINYNQAEDILGLIKNIQGINLTGIYSHFSSADEENKKFTALALLRELVRWLTT